SGSGSVTVFWTQNISTSSRSGAATIAGNSFPVNQGGATDTYQVVRAFDIPLGGGGYPYAGLIQGSDGSFYGTTYLGGAADRGTVFKMDAAGTLTTLHSFAGSDGDGPYAGLIQASDGSFYGTTSWGGDFWRGTVFKVDAAGTLT